MKQFYANGRAMAFFGHVGSAPDNKKPSAAAPARAFAYSLLLTVYSLFTFSLSAQEPRKDSGADGQKPLIVKGVIRSATDGRPLQGVSIKVEIGNGHTSTDRGGQFELPVVHRKGIVKLSHVGYQVQEIEYTVGIPLDITLKPSDNQLDEVEVVSTGYQKIPKERATGSFEFVDNKLFNRKVSTDFVSRLEDVVPGISSRKLFSDNRGDLPNFNIRGVSTMKSNFWPLIVVDGVPYESKLAEYGLGNFNNINPNDIENISVLKDAAAASIWGAQSGNGVVVITTKRGKFNEKTQISFNANVTVKEKPDLYYYPQIKTTDYIDLQRFLFDKGKYNTNFNRYNSSPEPILWLMKEQRDGLISEEMLNSELDKLRDIDNRDDFLNYIYRRAVYQQYNLQLRSGGDKVNSLFSAGYDKNLNNLVTSSYERLVLKSVSQLKPTKNLLLEAGITYTESKGKESYDGVGYEMMGLANYPYLRLADDEGNPATINLSGKNKRYIDTAANGKLLDWMFTPLNELYASQETQKLNEVLANFSATYSFDFGLKINGLYSYQHTVNPINSWRGLDSYKMRNEINYYANWNDNTVVWNIPVGDFMLINHYNSAIQQGRLHADYDLKWKDRHEISVLAGYDVRQLRNELTISQYYGYNRGTGTFQSVQYGKEVPVLNGRAGVNNLIDRNRIESTLNRYVSYYANASYTYWDKYILSASFRKDASNLFGVKSNDRGQPFWSVGTSWIASKESMLKNSVFDLLKMRATYGYNGNVNNTVSAYPIMGIQSDPNYITGQNYAMISSPPNPRLRWERVSNLNFGLDFNMFAGRFGGSIEYYHKKAKDLISAAPVDPSTGFTTLNINYASLLTKGWDMSFRGRPVHHSNWQWNTDLNFSYSRTRVSKAYQNPSEVSSIFMVGPGGLVMTPFEGMDQYSLLTYKWAGLDPEDGTPRAYLNGEVSKDYSAIISSSVYSLQNNGSTIPLYFGSFRNSVRYSAVELSWNIAYQLGHVFLRNTFSNDLFLTYGATHSDYAKRWQNPGDELLTDVPAFTYPNNSSGSTIYTRSSALVENAGQIKLRDIQINVYWHAAAKVGLHNLRLYGYAQNIGTIWRANKYGIDPEYGVSVPDPFMLSVGVNFNL